MVIIFEEIKKENVSPKTLEETIPYMPDMLYWLSDEGEIINNTKDRMYSNSLTDTNMLTSKEYAEAFLALMQLIRFRDIWNGDWKPNWNDGDSKYVIVYSVDNLQKYIMYKESQVLSFKTSEIRDKFLETFGELIFKAKPLL